MSVLDEFRKAEQQVVNRLRELQPLVAEHEQLRKVAERLGLNVSEPPAATQPRAAAGPNVGEEVNARRRDRPKGRRRPSR